MKMKRWLKSTVAMIALVSMLMENTYSVLAEVPGDNIAAEEAITVEQTSEESSESEVAEITEEVPQEELQEISSESETTANTSEEDAVAVQTEDEALNSTSASTDASDSITEEIVETEEKAVAEKSLNTSADEIIVEGEESITLYVNTDQMNSDDSFALKLLGSDSLDYDRVLSNTMNKNRGGVYYIKGLDNKQLTIEAVEMSVGMTVEYKVREDGNPQITLISADKPDAEKVLELTDNGYQIKGSGYDDLTITLDSVNVPKNTYYTLHVRTSANVTCNGRTVSDEIVPSLNSETRSLRLSNLDNEEFNIYIEGENVNTVAGEFSIVSVENGAIDATITVSDEEVSLDLDDTLSSNMIDEDTLSENEISEKRVYEYEDSDVSITVTLKDAEDLPDDAELNAKPITVDTNPQLLDEVTGRVLEDSVSEDLMPINFYVYDVFFTLDGEEVEPLNPVDIKITYKTKSETDYADESVDEIKTFHFAEDESGNIESMEEVTENVVRDSSGEVDTVTASLDSFSVVATVEYTKTRTFLGDGGAYSIGYILNNYNLFIKDTINDTNHTVGPIAAGGNSYISYWGKQGIVYPVNSYIKGKLTQGGWYESVGGGDLFLGTSNANQFRWTGNYWENNSTKEGIHGVARIYLSDNYMDFDQAFNEISSEVNGFNCDITIDRNKASNLYSISYKSGANTLDIKSGYTYTIDSLSGIDTINISGADVQSAVDTVLKVTSSETISLFPHVSVNGSNASSAEYGKSSSIVFLLPNTSKITMRSSHAHFGHIVAPNAYVDFAGNGDYNGCVIAKSFHSLGSEGHMWPYNGKKFNGTSTGFQAVKTVDGKEPTSDQVFEFTLEKWNGSSWVLLQTVKNNGSKISFDSITYTEKESGTHIYRIKESGKVDGYETNNTSYIVKVIVENKVESYAINQTKTESCYIGDTIYADKEVSVMSFDNITESGSIKLTKKLVTPGSSAKDSFVVRLRNAAGQYYDEATKTFVSQEKDILISAGETKTIDKLPYGDYTVVEVSALDVNGNEFVASYNVNGSLVSASGSNGVTVNVDGDETVVITNSMLGQISVTKSYLDATGSAINDGTVFYVTVSSKSGTTSKAVYYDTEGNESSSVKVVPVKAGETVVFKSLAAGRTYTVTEVDSKGNALSNGLDYDVIDGTQNFYLKDSSVADLTKSAVITNKLHDTGKINILKKDYTSGSAIDGAGFYLKNDDTDALIYVTGSNGQYAYSAKASGTSVLTTVSGALSVDGLPYGNYRIEEVIYPYGYEETEIVMHFNVGANGTVSKSVSNFLISASMNKGAYEGTYTVNNKRIPFKLRIVKKYSPLLGGNEKPLKGVTFTLTKAGSAQSLTAVTDEDGIAEFDNLDWGTYTYKESVPTGYIATSTSTGTFTIDNTTAASVVDFSGTPIYVVAVSNQPVSGGVKLVKSDKDTKEVMAGVKFSLYDASGAKVYSVLKNGVYTYASATATGATNTYVTDKNGEISVNGLPYGTGYYFTEETPVGYVVNNSKYSFNVLENSAVAEVNVKNEKIRGYVELLKKDSTDDSVLAGATFALYSEDGTKINEFTTNSKGMITAEMVGPLEYGNYYFMEIKAPAGYDFDAKVKYSFSIKENCTEAIHLEATNTRQTGEVSLIKYDAVTNKPLDGAVFGLYRASDLTTPVATGTTANGGKLSFTKLQWTKYVIKEISAPEGYELNDNNFAFEITSDNLSVDLTTKYTIDNDETKGAIKLLKNDGEGNTLAGAVFELYKDGKRYPDSQTTFVTDANGEIYVDELPWGTYYFVEISAPDGFVLPEGDAAKSSSVTIGANNTINALTDAEKANKETVHINIIPINNEKIYGSLKLHKVDSDGKALVGATFKLYSSDASNKESAVKVSGAAGVYKYDEAGSSIELETDATGTLTVTGLPYGNYSIYEEQAPAGYNKDSNPRKFEIKSQSQVAEYDFENTLVKANIKFIKVDDTDKPLQGVSFTLYKLIDGEYKAQTDVTSDKNGLVLVEGLGTGTYYFVENDLTGYEPNKEMYGFTIVEADNGKTLTLPGIDKKVDGLSAIVNIPKKGSAKIKKVETGKTAGLEGAVFALYNASTDKVVAGYENLVTDAEGYAKATNLPWGKYYFIETVAPKNYALDSKTKYEFEITAENVSEEINVGTAADELILGGGKLIKKDVTSKEVLSGAEFALYDNGGNLVNKYDRITSDAEGLVTTNADLNEGTYYFVETKAPEGYALDSETKYYFTIDQSNMGTIVEANAEGRSDNTAWNERIPGKAELLKYVANGSSKLPLDGAVFELYQATKVLGLFNSKTLIGTYTTDADGLIKAENLEWGDYYFVEITPPTGFDANNTPVEFTISQTTLDYTGAARLELENERSKGAIKLLKVDAVTGNKLVGAEFKLWKSVDGVVTQVVNASEPSGLYITDTNGEIVVKDLEWGTYYFEEVAAPAGYQLPAIVETDSVEINKNNVEASVEAPLVITVLNEKVYGSVELIKTNEDGTIVLEGAKFELYSDSDYKNAVYAADNGNGSYVYSESKSGATSTFVTNAEGKLTVDGLPVGTYYFKETEAPEGYLISTVNAGMFTIDERNTADNRANVNLKIVSVKDKRIKGYVELLKIDTQDNDTKLNGVEFDLYKVINKGESNQSVERIGHYETINGQIAKDTVGALEYGDYYFVETTTIPGYKLNTDAYEFTISEQDKLITITVENIRELGKVKLEKFNSDRSKNLNGAVFELYSTNPSGLVQRIAEIFGTTYHKLGEYTTANGGIITVEDLEWGNYYFVEKEAPQGYVADTETKYSFTINADSLDVELTGEKGATNKEEFGAIKLIKDDGEGHVLAGAEFEFYKDGERYPNAEKTYVTNDKGEIVVENLPYGTYYFLEISAPEGFVLPEGDAAQSSSVVINETTTVSTVEVNIIAVSNEKIYGSLKLRKVDGDGNELTGAEFYLVQIVDGEEKNVKVDGADGVYTYSKTAGFLSTKQILVTNGATLSVTGLPYGTYRVYEDKAPAGYNKVESPFEFKIDGQGKEVSYDFENSLIQAGVEFIKTDADGNPLAGAVFHLYKVTSNGTADLGTVTSDSKGKVSKSGLGSGEYFFVEEEAPVGYENNGKQYTFTITAADNGKVVSIDNADMNKDGNAVVVNIPKKGAVKLWKVVAGTNNGLEGAVFDLYKKGEEAPIKKGLVSDENGYVKVDNLPWGIYYFKETKAPKGYILEEDVEYTFEINANNVSAVVTVDIAGKDLIVENSLILGQAKLVKQNSVTNDPIEGAVFALYSAADDSVIAGYEQLVSDVDGVILTNKNLEAGSYYFKEVAPATGYEINESKYAFTIDQSNMDKVVSAGTTGIALNTPIKGKAELFKYAVSDDGLTKNGLEGAVFTLYYKETTLGITYNKEFASYTTDANGVISVSDLPWGDYYFEETQPPVGYKADKSKLSFTISATQLDYTGAYRLSLENTPFLGSVKLVKYYAIDGEQKGTLEGASFRFYRIDETKSVEIPNNTADGLYVTNKDGEIVISDLAWGSYYFVEEAAPEGYALPAVTKTDVITITKNNVEESIKAPLTTTITNDKIYGNVELLKVDDATPANKLAGAEFKLYTKDGDRVYVTGSNGVYTYSTKVTDVEMVTPEGGKIVVKQLPFGEYYFVETSAPDGYLVNDEHISFAITVNQAADDEPQVSKTCINSTVRAAVSFIKADTNADTPLAGAVFTLYKVGASEDGTDLEISDVVSDENGIVSYKNLGIGSYYFKEKSTPEDAYRLLTTKYTFTVTNADNGKVLSLDNAENNTVINYPRYGGVKLTKKYSVNGNVEGNLAGAVFELYRVGEDSDSLVKEYVTGTDGTFRVTGLEWGDYYFVEKLAPNGHIFDAEKKYSFTITQENVTELQLIEVNNDRENGSVELEKLDSVDNTPLDGVVFNLFMNYGKADEALIATLTTENGRAYKDGLAWGSYTLIEKSTIEGYVLNDTPYSFVIDGDHLTATFTGIEAIKNDRIRGYVELLKKDESTKAPMSDVQFELYKGSLASSKYLATYTTNASGKLVDEKGSDKIGPLDYGEYYFKEITPTGYVANEDELTFSIEKDGQLVSFTDSKTVFNTPEDGSVILKKTDENGKVLEGAVFTLYAKTPKTMGQTLSTLFGDAYEYGSYTTNENGEIKVTGLSWDSYYFVETSAPKGYEIIEPDKKYEFTIDSNSTKAAIDLGTIENRQQLGTLVLTKLDAENNAPLKGAEFRLYRVEADGDTDVSAQYGANAGVFVTADDGKITVSDVAWGSYYFLETKSPDGYEAISETNVVKSVVLTIDANNASAGTNMMQPQTAAVYNPKGYGYVSLKKTFEGEQPASLAGVEFALVNDNTNQLVGNFKTNEEGIITADIIGRLIYGDYHFEEVSVPVGISYSVSNFKLAFSITKSNSLAEPIEFTFVNSEIIASAKFVKVDNDTKEVIPGIKFNVYNKANEEVPATSVTSDNQGLVKVNSLPMGDYYFLEDEESAKAAGYVADTTKYTFSITPEDKPTKDADGNIVEKYVTVYREGTTEEVTTVGNTKNSGSIQLIKLGKMLSGSQSVLNISDAEFELYKDDALYMSSEEVAAYINGTSLVIPELPWGTYYFKEVKAPAGYVLPANGAANTNTVTLDATSVSASLTTPLICQMSDDSIRVYISKRDIAGTEELPGASMELYEANERGKRTGSPIATWTSGTTAKIFEIGGDVEEGLVAGKSYVIHENNAPIGFAMTVDICFTVNEDGSVSTDDRTIGSDNGMTIVVEDGALDVSVSKKELGTDTELSGASLRILEGEEVVESWISNGKSHKITASLEVGKSYTLEEFNPPKGYYTAEPITFTVKNDGTLQIIKDASASATVEAISGTAGSAVTLTMFDRPIRVEVSKKRLSGGPQDYVQGAELALYELEGEDYKQIFSWISPESGEVLIDYGLLQVGNRYKVVETKVPAGYVKADDLYFTVKDYSEFEKTDANGLVTQSVTMYDASVKAVFSKKSISGEEELPGATVQVVDESGKTIVEFVTTDKETLLTPVESVDALSAEEQAAYSKYNVLYGIKLEAGMSYIFREIEAPVGYALATDVLFRVDEQGNTIPSPVVMKDKPLEIKLSKKDIASDEYLEGATLQLINSSDEVVAEWVSGDKPVLFSIRDIDEKEAEEYSEVIPVVLPLGDYKMREIEAPKGYLIADDITITIDGSCVKADNGSIREETMYDYFQNDMIIEGTKAWNVALDSNGYLPADFVYPVITIELYRDSVEKGVRDKEPVESVVLADGTKNFAFGPLKAFKASNGQNYAYTYELVEVMPADVAGEYTSIELPLTNEGTKYTTVFEGGYINQLDIPETKLTGTKTFVLLKDENGKVLDDVKYDDITIYLLQNGKRVDIDGDGENECVVIKNGAKATDGVATFEFDDLPLLDENYWEYVYTVEEEGAEGYTSSVVYRDTECEIVNIPKVAPFEIKGVKTWVDPDGAKRPDVTIALYRDGKLFKTTKLSANNTFGFTGLYEYSLGYGEDEKADGHKYKYEIKEIGATGYDVTITYNSSSSATVVSPVNGVANVSIENRVKQEYIEISGTKFWRDGGDSSKRPEVTVNLLATDSTGRNKELVDTYKIPNTSTKYAFGTQGRKQLPKYDTNGKLITYEIEEVELKGYESVIDGFNITNTPSKVRVSKIDATNNAELPGAVLQLTKAGTKEVVDTWTSSNQSHYVEGLDIGSEFTLTELSAPTGYTIAKPVTFTVSANGVEQKVEMIDDPVLGSVVLTKMDSDTREILAGAEFNLYKSNGELIKTTGTIGNYTYSETKTGTTSLVVGSDGKLKVGKLPYGAYYFKEVTPPTGYELSSQTAGFSITENEVEVAVSYLNTRRKGSVTFTKANESGSLALAGAVFELYSSKPRTSGQAAASTVFSDAYYRYGTYTTNSDGRITVTDLPWDDYYFIEVQAPDGYVTNRDENGDPLVYTFSINGSNAGPIAINLGTITNKSGEVAGERVPEPEKIAEAVGGVLGVRSAPTSGVLGTRVGPATGDASAIALWLALLLSCIGTFIWLLTSRRNKKKLGKGQE